MPPRWTLRNSPRSPKSGHCWSRSRHVGLPSPPAPQLRDEIRQRAVFLDELDPATDELTLMGHDMAVHRLISTRPRATAGCRRSSSGMTTWPPGSGAISWTSSRPWPARSRRTPSCSGPSPTATRTSHRRGQRIPFPNSKGSSEKSSERASKPNALSHPARFTPTLYQLLPLSTGCSLTSCRLQPNALSHSAAMG